MLLQTTNYAGIIYLVIAWTYTVCVCVYLASEKAASLTHKLYHKHNIVEHKLSMNIRIQLQSYVHV